MIRVVALRKAAVAGLCGAAAMEAFWFVTGKLGLPTIDLVAQLSAVQFHRWPLLGDAAGLLAHFSIGICWAMFYAFFFWGRFHLRPVLQGLIFSIAPAMLAILVVYPELALMRSQSPMVVLDLHRFFAPITPATVASLLLSHALFGVIVGLMYRRPVGYAVGNRPAPPHPRRPGRSHGKRNANATGFMFATGIECSYPTIEHGRWRRDEMAATRHYARWQDDFELALDIGITHIRYGPPLHLILKGPGSYDWGFVDEALAYLHDHGPEPIVDLCHFGVPSWLGDFQNPEIARALADYAGAFAARFPWVRFYTPVNEMYVCARMSALDGTWNEQRRDERAFAHAAFNLARASIAMTDAILAVRADAIFVNSESSEFCQACCPEPEIQRIARFENERRFLPLDLIYAHPIGDDMRAHLHDHGFADADIAGVMAHEVPARSIIGVDYYEWNERLIDSDGHARALGELFGWYVIASQYYDRYKRPMMHTETNRMDASDGPRWLWRQWHNVQLLRSAGVPLVGFTWYSLTDQVDWDIGLSKAVGNVDPVGLADLNRDIRAVGLTYRRLIEMHKDQPGYTDCPALAGLLAS